MRDWGKCEGAFRPLSDQTAFPTMQFINDFNETLSGDNQGDIFVTFFSITLLQEKVTGLVNWETQVPILTLKLFGPHFASID